jgi:hypothetical protein
VIEAVFLRSTDLQEPRRSAPEEAQDTLAQLQTLLARNRKLHEMLSDKIRDLHCNQENFTQNPAMADMEIYLRPQNWNLRTDPPAAEFHNSTLREATTTDDHSLSANLHLHQLSLPTVQFNQISVSQQTQSQALASVWDGDQHAFDQLQELGQGVTTEEAGLFIDSSTF